MFSFTCKLEHCLSCTNSYLNCKECKAFYIVNANQLCEKCTIPDCETCVWKDMVNYKNQIC